MILNDLLLLLGFNKKYIKQILEVDLNISNDQIDSLINGLCSREYDSFYNEALNILKNDSCGLKMLKLMLLAACHSYDLYKEKDIDESIFIDTMKCFVRFTNEYIVSYHHFGFDRGFWTGKMLSLNIFRLGTLEYEFVKETNGNKYISIHIPSDAKLTKDEIDKSLILIKKFTNRYFKEFIGTKYLCSTWLLSPIIKEEKMVSLDSNIMTFMSYFNIIDSYKSEDYKEWVFKNRDLTNLKEFVCKTSLQEKLKTYILSGHEFKNGIGELKR